MFRSSTTTSLTRIRGCVWFTLAMLLGTSAPSVHAQAYCQDFTDVLLDTSSNCVSDPRRDRAFTTEAFTWKGHEYMILNRGNELSLFNIDDPANPDYEDTTTFGFGTAGDSDYDLLEFDVCDECRYAVLSHKVAGTVVFDLGTGSLPRFGGSQKYATINHGGIVFSKGSTEYVVTALQDSCDGKSAVFAINSFSSLQFIECVQDSEGTNLLIWGGQSLHADGTTFLYLGERKGGQGQVFRADGSGSSLDLVHTATPAGMNARLHEMSIDEHNLIGASAKFDEDKVYVWDLSNPGDPVERSSWSLQDVKASRVSIRSPGPGVPAVLWTAVGSWLSSTKTYLMKETGPSEFDNAFWGDESEPHNSNLNCMLDMDGALAPDGSALYLSRYGQHQVFDLSSCLGPTQAVANLTVTPAEVYPGQSVQIIDQTVGSYDRWRVWVEADGLYESGDTAMSGTNPHSMVFTVPKDVNEGVDYTGHVEVASDELTPSVPEADSPIGIDRAPTAGMTINPQAAVVGESVTLTASAEGLPSDFQPYVWSVTAPSGPRASVFSPSHQVTLNEAGDWTFKLTVNYDHGASGAVVDPDGDSKYEVVISQNMHVTSVAADFSINPSRPLHTEDITLNGSASKGEIASYEWIVYGPTDRGGDGIPPANYTECSAEAVCLIPGTALEWGDYTITLTVRNSAGDPSSAQKNLDVLNGAIQPTFTWSPANPEIGDSVLFKIDGVQTSIDKATWTMGGTGCDGESATQVCTPSLFNDCKALSFKYSSGGTKEVGLTVEIEGVNYTDLRDDTERTVTVLSSGSCGSGTTCSYTLSGTGQNFGPAGGTGTFGVNTSYGCTWTASDNATWITITAGTSDSGPGTVRYSVAANTGPARSGRITAAGKVFTVTQEAPYVPANFVMSNPYPDIGEQVTFTVDPILSVESWDFGEKDCDGRGPVINCAWLPLGACNTYKWAFPTAGEKSVTMKLVDGRQQTKPPVVQNRGECCTMEEAPIASFSVSSSEPSTGQTVYFTDTSSKSGLATKALGFSPSTTNPDIGQSVTFTLNGLTGTVAKATWQFGETGCNGAAATQECFPDGLFKTCTAQSFTFASGGTKNVSVVVELEGDGSQSAGPLSIEVNNSGTCDGDGGGGCSYSISPTQKEFGVAGGPGTFAVTTTAECAWEATTTSTWIEITNGSGTGAGTVSYLAAENPSDARTGYIRVEGRSHTVKQAGLVIETDNDPTAWLWTVSLVGEGGSLEEVARGTHQNFSYAFPEAGEYRVLLVASNCIGPSQYEKTLIVTDSPIEDFVVGAAVSLAGANETQWETDFRFFNPCEEQLDVRIEYEPEGTNNTDQQLVFREFELAANETRLFADIVEAIPGLAGAELSGSVRIESSSESGCKVLSVSRTFNDTPGGSLGLFVPALPVKRNDTDFLDLTGLNNDTDYRTNLRLVNYSDADVWVPLSLYDRNGDQIGEGRSTMVRGHSTKQINEIAAWLGVEGDIAPFSVRADVTGVDVQAFGTVVDNITGDSVLFLSSFKNENRIWLVGVASLEGVNSSQWRTDMWLYNPTGDWLAGEVEFVVGDSPGDVYGFEWPTLGENRIKQYLDIVGQELGLEETRGYIVLTGADGGPAPQVAARTYNLDLAGGTYGLNLRAFGSDDLLYPGETGYVVGISNSADQNLGFRTNVGLLNTDRDRWTGVRLTLIDVSGAQVGEPQDMLIAPGVLRQFDVAKKFGVEDVTGSASLKVEVTEGGGVAAYATEIDNRTQDSIYIPAQQKFMGVAR